MKRFAALALGVCLVAVVPGAAKKKPAKPIIETFEATLPGHGVLRFEVEEYSTDQDVQELAQAYVKGGIATLESTLNKSEKGRYRYELFQINFGNIRQVYPIRLIRSTSEGGFRMLYIIADAADWVYAGAPARPQEIGHYGYPYTVVQVRIDPNGKGVGEQVPLAAIFFNKQGTIAINPMPIRLDSGDRVVHLINMHAVSR